MILDFVVNLRIYITYYLRIEYFLLNIEYFFNSYHVS